MIVTHTVSNLKKIREMDSDDIEKYAKRFPQKIKDETLTEEEFKEMEECRKNFYELTQKPLFIQFENAINFNPLTQNL